ncbi:MAG: 2-oxoacid:acceptor oxidoreductase family protein, partial [Candidatus Omnitrophica bacterium]|nr:2-oxoacid:acceptor oxidoreductase family protein [Candidatus Omnitrophota bacterium]
YPHVNVNQRVTIDTQNLYLKETVILSPRTAYREADLKDRYERLLDEARKRHVNRIEYEDGRAPVAFIASGLAHSYLEHALTELGLLGKFPVLKLALPHPADPVLVERLTHRASHVVVVEEKRDFIESQVALILKDLAQEGGLRHPVQVWGKNFPRGLEGFPQTKGLNPSIVMERLIALFRSGAVGETGYDGARLEQEARLIRGALKPIADIPDRTPNFCPGCPHRDSASVLKEVKKDFRDASYMQRVHRRGSVDLVFHGDTGCYTMLMFEPYQELMHNYSGMGLGGATGAGIDPFIENKQVVFMGDGTFFHSGQAAISNSVKQNQDITYIILENKTTAMTGHQPTSATASDLLGRPTSVQDIGRILDGMLGGTASHVVRVNPEGRRAYKSLLETTVLKAGVKVIIADKECGITFQRRKKAGQRKILREMGFLPQDRKIQTTHEVCEFCLECTRSTGCPALRFVETPYGTKVDTDPSACESDGACHRIKACPAFEEVMITRRAALPDPLKELKLEHLPPPQAPLQMNGSWRGYIAGVGGMGVGTMTAILVRAAFKEGYRVVFSDRKGLAIRNGGIYSHITYHRNGIKDSPIIPYGKADLLMGLDLVESARALAPENHTCVAHPARTAAVLNSSKTPTTRVLTGKDPLGSMDLEEAVFSRTDPARTIACDLFALAEKFFQNKLFANLILLGVCYQKGFFPLGLESLEWAIRSSIPKSDLKQNELAFALGRKWVLEPALFGCEDEVLTPMGLLDAKCRNLPGGMHGRVAVEFRRRLREALDGMSLDEDLKKDFVLRGYDLVQYENLKYAEGFIKGVQSVYVRDDDRLGWEATRAVIHNLAKVMLIKDEIYVSYLLTRPEKLKRDQLRFGIDPERGDRIRYRHFNRPQFTLFRWNVEFDMETRNWQLKLMRGMKFLRHLLVGWHRRERDFRAWYQELVSRFEWRDERAYHAWCEVLRLPDEVRGYREVRYPHMEYAYKQGRTLLDNIHEFNKSPLRTFPDGDAAPGKRADRTF